MKTYQFAVFAVIGLLIAGVLFMTTKKKKPCGCGGGNNDLPATEVPE